MARLLPSTPDLSAAEESAPRVIGIDGEDADDLLGAIASGTARQLLTALHDEPAAPSELADRVDTSLQNAQYHLGKLEDAGMIEVIDTVYSEKGREMKVYAPADRPLVVVAGGEEETRSLRSAVSRLLGGIAALAITSLLLQTALRGFPFMPSMGASGGDGGGAGGDGAGGGAAGGGGDGGDAGVMDAPPTTSGGDGGGGVSIAEATERATQTATETARTTADAAAASGPGFPLDLLAEPGVLFFMGGLAVVLVVASAWYVRQA